MSATELLLTALVAVVLVVIALQVTVLVRGRDAEKTRSDAESRLRETSSQLAYAQAQAERAVTMERELRAAQEDLSARRAELASMSSQHGAAARSLAAANEQIALLTATSRAFAEEKSALLESQARLEQEVKSARQREIDTSKLLTDAKEEMAKEFKLMASTLLEEKGARLNEQQKATLSNLLGPFSKTLDDFKGKVEATREADLTAREGLIAQIRHLTELNQDIGAKAQSLTNALRGESKTRGMWGEAVLQRILELAGLREGIEFRTQASHHTEEVDGRLIPDVVLDLPRERAIVIDAKVSLIAYERFVSSADDDARAMALDDHSASIKRHIKDLSSKNYPSLYNLKSVDFTLLFVPIESALMAASEADPGLAQYALERHVALVSPNTLFTVLRTIEYIWRVDKTTRSMEEIVKRGGLMYDAAVRFSEHVVSIGDALAKATVATQAAEKALVNPRSGLVRQAEQLRDLGIKPKRSMPKKLSSAGDDLEPVENSSESGIDSTDLTREDDA
ncbi:MULTISPECIES: DNA recombination protein RmuC [Rhodanobacter]|uniref:DNA recombination protein RmuC n=1 Tax=Rhodanobacter TaxID=75309 RepID=UPI000411279C|nr:MULTISPECIES: DNA recombination protein RmuC [Rhodanobacter]TAN17340.1 MAG: DNA recombination protein RmuC [Rhodanobacter sp.]UJJ55100.1 DNA recombination protein RmuC [Rhodanobacter thiooxydans]